MDRYLRLVLTVIAAALVYLCIVLTPWAGVAAQTASRPGDPTGPAEMVIVGWRLPDNAAMPVQIRGRAEVSIANEVRVSGRVAAEPVPNTSTRVVLAGWEDAATRDRPGTYRTWNDGQRVALPVVSAPR
jgi:hypothetical protein